MISAPIKDSRGVKFNLVLTRPISSLFTHAFPFVSSALKCPVEMCRPFLEESRMRVPKHSRNFVCASNCSGKDSRARFIPWQSKLQ